MVKVCGITRREDAEAAVAAGASAIGFVFYPKSPRYVTPELPRELGRGPGRLEGRRLPGRIAGVIEDSMRAAHLDIAQIYGGDLPNVPRVWRAFE